MSLPVLRLNPKADYRLKGGHLWIYSNEIDSKTTPLHGFKAGDLAAIENAAGKFMGVAYINPNTLICGRIISTENTEGFTKKLLEQRIRSALQLREQIFTTPCYRLIYGESDWLPGLVVDRFYDVLVVQIATAGMERYIEQVVAVLDLIIKPKAILIKNDSKMREVEGLEAYIKWVKGTEISEIPLEENGVKFNAPVDGQKTGWFYDHRMNRARLKDYVKGKRVLDVFSYIGGWGIQAAAFGASDVTFIDSSESALAGVQRNAELNSLTNISTIKGDAFDVMSKLIAENQTYDVVILDPPALIPRRKDIGKGSAAYLKANLLALQLLNKQNGILFSASCSMHLAQTELLNVVHRAANKLNLNVQILEQGHQSPDHPIHLAIPETQYLKNIIVRCNSGE